MKKKILIVSHFMNLGGVERSLLGLLDQFDYDQYDVSLFLFRHEGELMPYIPKQVHLLPEVKQYTALACPIKNVVKRGQLLLAGSRVYGKLKASFYDHRYQSALESAVGIEYSHKYTKWLMPQITPDVTYDLAISFLTPHYFVAEKVHAKVKIAWIHTDYTKIMINRKSELSMWSKYDHIAAISQSAADAFDQIFPQLKDKVTLIENILPKNLIQQQSNAFSTSAEMPDDGNIKLLSVGRFSNAKNFDNVPEICSLLIQKGLHVKWYLIGYGADEGLIRSKIQQYHMEDKVILLGKKDNPYPYMKACDLYIQPSRYEGKCVSVREAQMLCKPVVITKYPTSASQLEDGVDGVIVPMDNTGCAEGIYSVLTNKELLETLRKNCADRDYSNAQEITKVYSFIEDR